MSEFELRTALLSVHDKTGIELPAPALADHGVKLLSTGGTAKALRELDIPYVEVEEHTGFPEIMDGRVKTLHPRIHGGILGRRNKDQSVMEANDIEGIDLVVVNLYPFADTISREDCTRELAIENIDIGGPAMVRAAAKNHADVLVLVDPADYNDFVRRMDSAELDLAFREVCAAKAFRHTASYDAEIARYLSEEDEFSERITRSYEHLQSLRYGENPHQRAALYVDRRSPDGSLATASVLQGKELSYNNYVDVDAALACCAKFEGPTCVIVKHANPCGVATAGDLETAYQQAFETDQTSAFGGIIALNGELDAATLSTIIGNQFVEVIAAPSVSAEALRVAKSRKNLRLLETGELRDDSSQLQLKQISGGVLLQDADSLVYDEANVQCVTTRQPTDAELRDLQFAWKVAWFVKSNAIVFARDSRTIGVGAGQMSRVESAKIARMKAEDEQMPVAGSVMASDAFFPFRDGIDAAADAGIVAVIQPGGSVRDDEVIEAANEYGMTMLFTGTRHFRH